MRDPIVLRLDQRVLDSRYEDGVTIRSLRDGDNATVEAVFGRMSHESRRRRFGGAKPRLSTSDLAQLARVGRTHHVLVAYVDGDPLPAGIARYVRNESAAEVAYAVVDEHQGRGVGSKLARALVADARASGIVELHAFSSNEDRRVLSLLSQSARRLQATWADGECTLVAALA
jgi:GNAT superfamily N-acetyltransferase